MSIILFYFAVSKKADIDTLERDVEAQKELNSNRVKEYELELELKRLKEEAVQSKLLFFVCVI